MKKSFLIFILCALSNFTFAQPVIEWQRCLGGSRNDYSSAISHTLDGGLIVCGTSYSNDDDALGHHGLTNYSDALVVKLDSAGNTEWAKSFGGSLMDNLVQIIPAHTNGYIGIGYSRSTDGDVSGNIGNNDSWIVKMDNSGNIQWQKCLGGMDDDEGVSIIKTIDNGYAIISGTNSNDIYVTGNHGTQDILLSKLDSSGGLVWQKCFGGSSREYPVKIIQLTNGDFVVSSSTTSNNGDVNGNHGTMCGGPPCRDFWIFRTDGTGVLKWQKCLGGDAHDYSPFIYPTYDGGFVLHGYTQSNNGDVSGLTGTSSYLLFKLDSAGTILWQKCYGGSGGNAGRDIYETTDKGFLITGGTSSNDGQVSGNNGSDDAWIIKTDSAGNLEWQKCFGGTFNEGGICLAIINHNEFAIVGNAGSNDGDLSGFHGTAGAPVYYNDFWVVKLRLDANTITGKLFYDFNNNQVKDPGEPPVANQKINELTTGGFTFSQANGDYYLSVLDSGNFTIQPASLSSFATVPVSRDINFSGSDQTDSLNDFAFQPIGTANDLRITITPESPNLPGYKSYYKIHYFNAGTTTLSGSIILFRDTHLTFMSSLPAAASITSDSIAWNFPPLAPAEDATILVTDSVSISTPVNTFITSSVPIEPLVGDVTPLNNFAAFSVPATGSYEPNAILVSRDSVDTSELSSPPYLDYLIYFQNTGNDTAYNVRVGINISKDLDLSTFEFVTSSHPVNINYDAHSRFMEFNMDSILLPNYIVNELMSHGFVRYRIKPATTLLAGDRIKNSGAIYFDSNYPVLTDTAITEIVLTTEASAVSGQNSQFKVFPNPTTGDVTIKASKGNSFQKISLFSIDGRMVFELQNKSQPEAINLNFSRFDTGIYFLKVTAGERVINQKLIIQ